MSLRRSGLLLLCALVLAGLAGCSGSVSPPPAPAPPAPPAVLPPEGWTPLGGPPGPVTALVAVPAASAPLLYAATRQGVYQSADGGAQWAALPGPATPPGPITALLPVSDTTWSLLVGTSRGLWGWAASGRWEQLPLGTAGGVTALAPAPDPLPTLAQVIVGTRQGVVRLAATGTARRDSDRGTVRALRMGDGGRLYVATNTRLRTLDAAGSATDLVLPGGGGAVPPQIFALARAGDRLLLATDRGVFARSGDSWDQLTRSPARTLAALPGGDWLVGGDGGVITARLTDDDAANMERGAPVARVGLPAAPVYALVAVGGQLFAATEGGVYASTDGIRWQGRFAGLPPAPRLGGLVTITGDHPAELYAGTPAGAFRSDDGGTTWRLAATGLPPGGVRDLALTGGTAPVLLAATSRGVYLTGDGAATWQPTPGQPGPPDVRRLWSDPNDGQQVYAALGGAGGLARSWNRGKNWVEAATRLPPATWVTALLLDGADTSRPTAGVRYLRRSGVWTDPAAPAVWRPVASSGPDGGEMAWQPVGVGLPLDREPDTAVTALGRGAGAAGPVLAATTAGVWTAMADVEGIRWTPADNWPVLAVAQAGMGRLGAFATYPLSNGDNAVYVGSDNVIARSSAAAPDWTPLGRPPQTGGIAALAVLPISATTATSGSVAVLAAVAGQGLWQYQDSTVVIPPVGAVPVLTPAARPPRPTDRQPPGEPSYFLYFPETGHNLGGGFRTFWEGNDGLQFYGYPISEEFAEFNATDNITRTVQYFQRARLELHTDATAGFVRIQVGLLGRELTAGQFFVPTRFFVSDDERAYFAETQHSIRGAFYGYWRDNDGLRRFGYPISEELREGATTVQYFERARFELYPEGLATGQGVRLGLLGVEALQQRGWLP